MPSGLEWLMKVSSSRFIWQPERKSTRKKVFNFANALSKRVLVCYHTQGNRCCEVLAPTTGRKWGLRKRNYPLSPTWQVRGQTCSLLAEQETCFLSLLGLFWPWLPALRFESEMKQMLRQGKKNVLPACSIGKESPWDDLKLKIEWFREEPTRLGCGSVGTYSGKMGTEGNLR